MGGRPATTEASDGPAEDLDRRRGRLLAAVVLLVLIAGVAGLSMRSEPTGLALARRILDDDGSFATPIDAGVALTRISVALQDAGEGCSGRGNPPASAVRSADGCSHLFSAAAYSRVAAVQVLPCTRRGVAAARSALRSYLERLEADPATSPPPLPECAEMTRESLRQSK